MCLCVCLCVTVCFLVSVSLCLCVSLCLRVPVCVERQGGQANLQGTDIVPVPATSAAPSDPPPVPAVRNAGAAAARSAPAAGAGAGAGASAGAGADATSPDVVHADVADVVKPAWKAASAAASTPPELLALLEQPANAVCADCGASNPNWAAIVPDQRGVFVCTQCSGCHRNGVSERIASVHNDSWSDKQVQFMAAHGNAGANVAAPPAGVPAIGPDTAPEIRFAYIVAKYGMAAPSSGAAAAAAFPHLPGPGAAALAGPAAADVATATNTDTRSGGHIMVVAVRASDLEAKDVSIRGASSDPYVTVTAGGSQLKSKVVAKSLDPVWGEVMGMLDWDGSRLLRVQVWDFDALTADDDNGHTAVDLTGIPPMVEQELTLPLQGVAKGSVTLNLTFFASKTWE